MMDLDALTTGGSIGVLTAIVLLTNAITRWLTRWQVSRSAERKDTLTQIREAYEAAMLRVAHLEGRTDELSRGNAQLQTRLSDERVQAARTIAGLEGRIAHLEHELDDAREENARLRGLAPTPRTGGRRPTPPHPIAAQPDND